MAHPRRVLFCMGPPKPCRTQRVEQLHCNVSRYTSQLSPLNDIEHRQTWPKGAQTKNECQHEDHDNVPYLRHLYRTTQQLTWAVRQSRQIVVIPNQFPLVSIYAKHWMFSEPRPLPMTDKIRWSHCGFLIVTDWQIRRSNCITFSSFALSIAASQTSFFRIDATSIVFPSRPRQHTMCTQHPYVCPKCRQFGLHIQSRVPRRNRLFVNPGLQGLNLEAQQRYFSYRAILVAIVSQFFFVLVFVGYRTSIARYVAKWGIAQTCLCETKY